MAQAPKLEDRTKSGGVGASAGVDLVAEGAEARCERLGVRAEHPVARVDAPVAQVRRQLAEEGVDLRADEGVALWDDDEQGRLDGGAGRHARRREGVH